MGERPLFLERRRYRARRIMDVVRFLPFVCAVLWLVVPMMWPRGTEGGETTALSHALWYIFVIWCLAIAAGFALWRRIREPEGAAD